MAGAALALPAKGDENVVYFVTRNGYWTGPFPKEKSQPSARREFMRASACPLKAHTVFG